VSRQSPLGEFPAAESVPASRPDAVAAIGNAAPERRQRNSRDVRRPSRSRRASALPGAARSA